VALNPTVNINEKYGRIFLPGIRITC
jgi:hypothetical protein